MNVPPKVLARGIDTLKLGIRGTVPPHRRERIKNLARVALGRSESDPVFDEGLDQATGRQGWQILPPPPKWYEARLVLPGVGTFLLGRESLVKNNALTWEPECRRLWVEGWERCWAEGEELAEAIFADGVDATRLSRVDLALDGIGFPFSDEDPRNFSTRAKYTAEHGPEEDPDARWDPKWAAYVKGPRRETLRWGKGSTVVRIYDKSAELEVSGKVFFLPIWGLAGRTTEPVWRVEAQLRRARAGKIGRWEVMDVDKATGEFRGVHSLDTREGLRLGLRSLWRSIFGDPEPKDSGAGAWLVQRVPAENEERRRWPVHPAWRVVQAGFEGPDAALLRLPPEVPDAEELLAQWGGLTTTLWATLSLDRCALLPAGAFLADAFSQLGERLRARNATPAEIAGAKLAALQARRRNAAN